MVNERIRFSSTEEIPELRVGDLVTMVESRAEYDGEVVAVTTGTFTVKFNGDYRCWYSSGCTHVGTSTITFKRVVETQTVYSLDVVGWVEPSVPVVDIKLERGERIEWVP